MKIHLLWLVFEVFITNRYCWRIHAWSTNQGIKRKKEA